MKAESPPIARQRAKLRSMRLAALALLLVMLGLMLVGRVLERTDPRFAFLVAFAEAATVGGLADWFAVTALFRRPLGLPIPHTAIIARSKDRIGEGLGRFIEQHFLDPVTLEAQLAGLDFAGALARWLRAQARRSMLAQSLAEAAPHLLRLANDPEIARALSRFAEDRLRGLDASSLLANVLSALTAQGRHQPLIERAVALADQFLRDNEAELRRRVREETGFVWRLFSVDRKASDALITAVQSAIRDMAEDPRSSWRVQMDEAITAFIERLRTDGELRAEVDAGKHALMEQGEIKAYLSKLWIEVKQELRDKPALAAQELAPRIEAALAAAGRALQDDPAVRRAVNDRLRDWALVVARERREDVSRFVADTIKSWDARTIIERIEAGVGPDLQYIRISGTLIGGCVGVALHAVGLVLP